MAPKVSVIVPLYNQETYIGECIRTILAQSFTDFELIIINDGSTDNSSGAIPRDDKRIFITHMMHHGVSAARNCGLDRARGELIAFCDADDWMDRWAIGKMVKAIDGADMVCGSFRKFGDFEMIVTTPTRVLSIKDVAEYVMGNLRNPRSNQMLSGCWAKLYRHELMDKFPLLVTAEDMAFNFDYLTRCKNVRFIDDIVYHNRKRDGSLTTTFDAKDKDGLFGVIKALKYVERFLAENYQGKIHGGYYQDEVNDALDSSKVYHSMLYAQRIGKDALKKIFPC